MKLCLIRHARAEPRTATLADASRALTPAGRREFVHCVRGLRRLDLRPERIWTSPFLRALETSEIARAVCDGEVHVVLELARPVDFALIEKLARARAEGLERLALVGHEPWLGDLASWLTTGWRAGGAGDSGSTPPLTLEKGGVIVLDGDPRPGHMRLIASLPPGVLAELGRRRKRANGRESDSEA